MTDRMYTADLYVTVSFRAPEDAITRVLENHDAAGVPQPRRPMSEGGSGFRDTMYDLPDEEAVVRHLALNFLRGLRLDQLDGWADYMPEDGYSGRVESVGVESFKWEPVQ